PLRDVASVSMGMYLLGLPAEHTARELGRVPVLLLVGRWLGMVLRLAGRQLAVLGAKPRRELVDLAPDHATRRGHGNHGAAGAVDLDVMVAGVEGKVEQRLLVHAPSPLDRGLA